MPVRGPVLRRSAWLSPCWPWSKPPHPDSPTYHCARAARSSVFCFSPCPVSDVRLHSTAAAADVPACLHHLGSIATLIADPVLDRKSVVSGKSVSVRVAPGGRRVI